MRRIVALAVVAVAALAILVVGTGQGDSSSGYVLRAEFRNAFTVNPGEEVKVAGVVVGSIRGLDVTPRQTAVVVMDITQPGFGDFRSDAQCTIRPQSLIGERFVECTPTQPRDDGRQAPPPLRTIEVDGETQNVLPMSNTVKPIDLDLVANTLRLPYRQRLSIILNELGAGTAARGADIEAAVRNANPALKQTDRVIEILAEQNEVLDQLAVDSDTALAPLADQSQSLQRFVRTANTTAEATAERRTALERSIQLLPAALRQLQPTMNDLEAFAEQTAPLARDLNSAAPQITRLAAQLGPFAEDSTPALQRLGDASETGRTALNAARPIVGDLREFAAGSRTLASDLDELTASLDGTGGIDRLLDFVFYSVTSANGYDQFGHYVRSNLLLNLCATYATVEDPACSANYGQTDNAIPRASLRSVVDRATADGASPLDLTAAVLRGASARDLLAGDATAADAGAAASSARAGTSGSGGSDGAGASPTDGSSRDGRPQAGAAPIALPAQVLPGSPPPAAPAATPSSSPTPAAAAPTAPATTEQATTPATAAASAPTTPSTSATAPSTSTATTPAQDAAATGTLLDFLLGGGS